MINEKIFLSCDIEGTCGIAAWDETESDKPGFYLPFAEQMSREVAAACEGAMNGGAQSVLVRDAHDSARNIRPDMLPDSDKISLLRGWTRDPYGMMAGLDNSFGGALFTGYHSAVSWSGNPLSHTMNSQNIGVKINGEMAPELMMNALTASMMGVPVLFLSGDEQLCQWFKTKVPAAVTVPVSHGIGNGSVSIMPGEAVRRIRQGVEEAMQLNPADCMFPMPEHFTVEVTYRLHQKARSVSWYPGAVQLDERTVRFESDDWFSVLTFFHFCL